MQTAVEWFFMTINIRGLLPNQEIVECYEEAKEIEKEQIMRAFALGQSEVLMYEIGNRKDGEDYYNETYGK